MDYVLVCGAALVVAALTLFSGFGLGTLLMPVFALFFPVEVAVAATAVVHLANNLFKVALLGRAARWDVIVKFGVAAAIAALLGAWVLTQLSGLEPLAAYDLGSRRAEVTPVKLVLAVVIGVFAVLELWPRFEKVSFPPKFLPIGGVLSGFFGGLSGHQGALRSAFLLRLGLTKEQFIATGVVCAVIIDLSRLPVYAVTLYQKDWPVLRDHGGVGLIGAAIAAAFVGTIVGVRLVKKVTLGTLRSIVGVMLLLVAAALGAGIV